jgi:hypothetical protein
MLESSSELLHLEGVSFDSFIALADEREHDRRDSSLGARRRNKRLGRAVTLRRRPVTRRSAVSRR